MSLKFLKIASLLLVLSTFGFGQVMYLGPLNQPPLSPSLCIPDTVHGQTGICFASDGVHVSIAGQPFGPPLPVSGPMGPSGPAGVNGLNGIQGPPGTGFSKGTILTYTKTETCGGSTGTIKSGYTNTCTGTLTITSIQ